MLQSLNIRTNQKLDGKDHVKNSNTEQDSSFVIIFLGAMLIYLLLHAINRNASITVIKIFMSLF